MRRQRNQSPGTVALESPQEGSRGEADRASRSRARLPPWDQDTQGLPLRERGKQCPHQRLKDTRVGVVGEPRDSEGQMQQVGSRLPRGRAGAVNRLADRAPEGLAHLSPLCCCYGLNVCVPDVHRLEPELLVGW